LPDRSAFFPVYDAQAREWSGTLVIPGCPTFEARASGVFKLLSTLDGQYRTWLAGNLVVNNPVATEVTDVG
jgi:hypothetical protein